MAEPFISIEVHGIDTLIKNLDRFEKEIKQNIGQAGMEAATGVILPTIGLQKYPPSTIANQPPTPYYVRGRGTQTAHGNLGNSERLGTKFYVKQVGWTTKIFNTASYAPYVIGDEQAKAMERIGWRKLKDVANEKINQIRAKYQAWIDYTIRKLGL